MMTRLKLISSLLFTLLFAHTVIATLGNPLNSGTKGTCIAPELNSLIPWDSGCFYSAFFKKEPPIDQIKYEHHKLTVFKKNGGVAQHILWYRSIFYQRFRDFFNTSYDLIDEMHKDFTKVKPTRTSSQVAYLNYLTINGEKNRAQKFLNYYCENHVPIHRASRVVDRLTRQFNELRLNYSLNVCRLKYQKIN